MNEHKFPVAAETIYAEWTTTEGGIAAVAFTDEYAMAFLGIFPLNGMGRPSGMPVWLRRDKLASDLIVGFKDERPLMAFVNVEVSDECLSLEVTVPRRNAEHYQKRAFTKWGGEKPQYGYLVCQVNSNWPMSVFPTAVAPDTRAKPFS